MNHNASQNNTFYLHAFQNGIQSGSYEGTVLMLDDDSLALYRSHFFLDSIPGAMNVIAGGGILFIMFHMKYGPAV